jgi:cell shape-determining protein MreD
MNFALITLALFVLAAVQARFPTLWWLGGLRLEFLPALVAFGALTYRPWAAVSLAVVAGALQDAASAAPFGTGILAYASVTVFLTGLHDTFDREMPPLQVIAGALASGTMSVVACLVTGYPRWGFVKIIVLALLSAVFTPLLFLAFDAVRYSFRRRAA